MSAVTSANSTVNPPATGDAQRSIQADEWLSAVCDRRIARVAGSASECDPSSLRAALNQSGFRFAFAKLGADQVSACHRLVDVGFRVVDVSVTLEMAPHAVQSSDVSAAEIVQLDRCESHAASRHPLAEVAGECFRFSRFHLDPDFPNALADEIKRQWIVNYLSGGRGDRLFAARVEGRWAGFLASLVTPDGTAVIDLIGVGSDFQGRGLGGHLIAAFQQAYAGAANVLRVGTQVANAPSLRLYQKQGFRPVQSAYVLHWHAK